MINVLLFMYTTLCTLLLHNIQYPLDQCAASVRTLTTDINSSLWGHMKQTLYKRCYCTLGINTLKKEVLFSLDCVT